MVLGDVTVWQAAGQPRIVGPEPGAEGARRAYLELLKLSLCDLAGTTTGSVGHDENGSIHSRELAGDQLGLRAVGMDWPLHGLTMVGLRRLDDLQKLVESVVADGVEGDLIEAGTWRGGASILMRATLDSLGQADRTVVVADSFAGFPVADGVLPDRAPEPDRPLASDYVAVPLAEVAGNFARFGLDAGVRFVEGFFDQTMPSLAGGRWAVIRLDGDSYDATRITLETLYPDLAVGGYVVVDDYGALDDCRRAVDEFRERNGIDEPLAEVDWTGVHWRKDEEVSITSSPASEGAAPASRDRLPRSGGHVPSLEEIELLRERDELRARLADAEAELRRLRSAPFAGTRAWLTARRGA